MNKEKELQEKYNAQDKLCTDLINSNPFGYHEREFEELVLLGAELKGAKEMKEKVLEVIKKSEYIHPKVRCKVIEEIKGEGEK